MNGRGPVEMEMGQKDKSSDPRGSAGPSWQLGRVASRGRILKEKEGGGGAQQLEPSKGGGVGRAWWLWTADGRLAIGMYADGK